MSTTTTTTHLQPRRRAAGSPQSPPCIEPKDLAVRKGSTFHQPKLPASPIDDPVINFKTLPSRSLTSPQDLEDLVSESDKRVDDIIASFDRSLSGIGSGIETSLGHEDKLPVPSSIAAHVASKNNLMVFDGQSANKASINREATSVYKPLGKPSFAARPDRALSDYAAKVIKLHIIDPIVEEESLKDFHLLVKGLPQRIGAHQIRCLRDLEKVLIFLAPHTAKSAASYLDFCEVSIQCIHTTVDHLNELDLRRPTDRPYTNNYFVDLVEQVRQYARIMANSRQKKLKGQPLDNSDIQPGEKILLRGGVAEGKPVELVRERDGKIIPIEGANVDMDEDMLDDDVQRSMARKRKCDIGKVEYRACRECGKVYTRPCDLTKHEKTHSRPWKCTDSSCKYYELGWPTEKERDRHMNDKHSSQPALYQCLWKDKGCAYTSKRESNCKQHMEKAHGWDYIRSKSKKGTKLTASAGSPIPQLMPTPGSERYSTPASTVMSNASPAPIFDGTSPADSTTSGYGSMSSYQPSTAFAPSPASSEPVFSFNDYNKNFSYNGFLSPTASEGRRDSTNGSTGFVPEVSLPPTFEQDFNFNNLNYDWSTLGDCFPQYNIPQQPTPVTSDFELDFDLNKSVQSGSSNDFSPAPQDLMLFGQGDILMQESQGFADFASGSKSGQQASNDFTLFGEVPSGQTSHDVSAAMFPDLEDMSTFAHESTAGMFDQMSEEEMDRYLYGDGN